MSTTVSRPIVIFSYKGALRIFKIALALVYSTFFIYVLFFARRRRHLTQHFFNLRPVNGTIDNFRKINPEGNHEYYNFYLNLFGNIALFIPFSIFLISLFGIRKNKRVLLISFIASLLTECLQFVFYRGVADVDDILLNMTGALLGCFICKIFLDKWEARLIRE